MPAHGKPVTGRIAIFSQGVTAEASRKAEIECRNIEMFCIPGTRVSYIMLLYEEGFAAAGWRRPWLRA